MLPVISGITILFKSLQMIWVYITSFKVCWFFSLSVSFSACDCAVTLTPHFEGTWNCSHQGNLAAIKKWQRYQNSKEYLI